MTKTAKKTGPKADEKAKMAAAEGIGEGEADGGEETIKVPSFRVQIVKDAMMKTSVRAYEHEIGIYQEIHGEDNVVVDEGSEKETDCLADAAQEHERLITRFGRNGQAAVLKVYPSPAVLASVSGLSFAGGRARAGRRSASANIVQSSQRGAGAD